MKRLTIIILVLSACIFAQQDIAYYSDSLVNIVDIDTATSVDTTDYSTNLLEDTGIRPSRIYVAACISDSTLDSGYTYQESPSNTAIIDVYGYSNGFYWHIVQWDKNEDWGTWIKYIENFSYSKIRFITRSNTGWVRIDLQLVRSR
jgi:hypothetical protein